MLPPLPRGHVRTLLAGAVALLAACAPDAGRTPGADDGAGAGDVGGTLVITAAAPGTLLPPHISSIAAKQLTDLVFQRLADIGPSLNTLGDADFIPRLAREWTWSDDSLAITFRLHPGARWHDGAPVTSEDVRFTVALTQDPAAEARDRSYLTNVDSVSTPDSLTATVWFSRRTPEQFYDVAGRAAILPAHLLGDVAPAQLRFHDMATRPVGSGRFRFARAEPGAFVELVADTAHVLGRPKLDRVRMTIAADPVSATAQVFAGAADLYEGVRPENLPEIARAPDVVAVVSPGTSYGFLAFNLRAPGTTRPHPILADREMRRALTMLVDRPAMVRAILDTLGIVGAGPFPRALPVADTTLRQLAHDPQAGAALLDSLGWRRGADGTRARGGRPLAIGLLIPSSSAIRVRMATALQQQLAAAGVRLELRQLEFVAFQAQMRAGEFDTVLNAYTLTDGSIAGMADAWGTGGAQNFGGYANPIVDALLDSATTTFDAATRQRHVSRAYQGMLDDAPAIWLYEPHNAIALHRRFRTPPLRSVNWWLDMHEWWIPAGERLPRDRGAPAVAGR